MKHVVQFSSGSGSALAAKRVADKYGTKDLILIFADVNMEDVDNYRFLHEAHQWIGGELIIIDNDGQTIWDIFKKKRFLGNTRADPCSRMLKREPIRNWIDANCDPSTDIIYLGFDWLEIDRHDRAVQYWKPFEIVSPLMWEPLLDKQELLSEMPIKPPQLTLEGFPHANCGGGCVKAGLGHFAKLFELRPETFLEWERKEEEIRQFLNKDVAILRDRRGGKTKPLTLRQFRKRLEDNIEPLTTEESLDLGACNCMTPLVDNDQEVEVLLRHSSEPF